jgi:hypothetical protein
MQPEDFFADPPDARAVFEKVRSVLDRLGPERLKPSGWQRPVRYPVAHPRRPSALKTS